MTRLHFQSVLAERLEHLEPQEPQVETEASEDKLLLTQLKLLQEVEVGGLVVLFQVRQVVVAEAEVVRHQEP